MRHFITFQKKKGLFLEKGTSKNESLVHQINHELMAVGYIMTRELFDMLSTQSEDVLNEVYNDLSKGIRKIVGGSGYEPIYRNFPQSVMALSYTEFAINAILHYWSFGTWRPEDAEYLNREFRIEPVNYKAVGLLTESEYNAIFSDILYSGTSISKFDKEIVDFYIESGGDIKLNKIKFKETLAYVGKRLLDSDILVLPTRNATDVLRVYSAYSGGDEGLKVNTKFVNPSRRTSGILRRTLDNCYNLEDSFKSYREKWLRLLFYLNPMAKGNRTAYPNLYKFSDALRNDPASLETFNAKLERMIREKDTLVFNLLKPRQGVFTRRLDHLVRVFGKTAIDQYLALEGVTFPYLVSAYNHFTNRDKEQSGRGAILAGAGASNVVTYSALEPLDSKLVAYIKEAILSKLRGFKLGDLKDKKVFIARELYYTPLEQNNRASNLSLDSKAIGTAEKYTEGDTLRMYVHWHGTTDIDLSGFAISKDNEVLKVGWNANHHSGEYMVYSGDNTGWSSKNAEYLDINTSKVPKDIEWIITEARIYRGYSTFAGYNGKARIGWTSVKYPEANAHWLPQTISNAMVLTSKSRTAYLMAYHAPTQTVVYLDMAMGNSAVSTNADALRMRMFLEKFVTVDDGDEVSWDRLNQGHLLELRGTDLVSSEEEADIVFSERTSLDEINRLINA